jgi:hypothetical protein
LEWPDLRAALNKLTPDQSFRFLSDFYEFAEPFGLSESADWESKDGWKRPLRFSFDGNVVLVWSVGPDGVDQFGEGDDVAVEMVLKP